MTEDALLLLPASAPHPNPLPMPVVGRGRGKFWSSVWTALKPCDAAHARQVGDEPAKLYKVGESFSELPGSYHRISENASDKDPASLLAIFVVDSKDTALTTPDRK